MKIKNRPDDVSMVQLDDWLAELREDDHAEPPGGDRAEPPGDNGPGTPGDNGPRTPGDNGSGPVSLARPEAPAEPYYGPAEPYYRSAEPDYRPAEPDYGPAEPEYGPAEPEYGPAEPDYRPAEPDYRPAEPDYRPAEPDYRPAEAHPRPTVRALIGDQLRMPVMWCEMGSCISWHADPAALGERDMRARAIGVGWRIDALGRLVCPRCQQTDPNFRTCHQVVPWDRHTAMARAARVVAGRGEPAAVTRWHLGADKRGH
jgi:hypothetical protein